MQEVSNLLTKSISIRAKAKRPVVRNSLLNFLFPFRSVLRMHLLPGVDHSMQIGGGIFDVEMLVLACSAFSGEHAAAMDIFEIAVGKFVSPLGILMFLLVDA